MLNQKCALIILSLLTLLSCEKSSISRSNLVSNDSLPSYLSIASNSNIPLSERRRANTKALDILRNKSVDSTKLNYIFDVASNYFSLEDWKSFQIASKLALINSIKTADTISIAKAYRYKAEYYKAVNLKDSAFFYYLKAEKLYTRLNDKESLGRIYLKKGIIQFYANDYLGADISTSQAYNLLRNSADKEIVYQAISMMGIISNEMKDYWKAIKEHSEALELVRKYKLNDQFNQEATSLNNIGNVYQNLGLNEDAVRNFKDALRDRGLQKETPDLYAILLDNLAYSQLKLRDYDQLPDLFWKALEIRQSMQNLSGMVLSKIHISEYYSQINAPDSAKIFANEALEIAKASKAPGDILAALKQLSTTEHENASIYSREYIRINDSLQQAERKSQNKFARIQLETNELIEEKDKLAEQNRNLVYFFIGSSLIGILLFVIRNQRSKNRELLLIQAQQKANEEIYNLMISQQATIEESRVKEKKRIAQELHDGILGRLFGARLNLDSLNKFNDGDSIASRFNYLNELKNIEQDIREISHDLNREKYALINNFLVIVNNLLEEQKQSHTAKISWAIDENIQWESVTNTLKINLFRILQESLQNINKYADASIIQVELLKEGSNIRMQVRDNGKGFDTKVKKMGIGLQNIEARTRECGGTLSVQSKSGKGTNVLVIIPI